MTKNEDNGTPYRKEALYAADDTTVDEIVAYLRHCIENPIIIGDNVIWNFSTHEPDMDALQEVEEKREGKFLIPYQVTGMWGFISYLLPDEARESEILIYHADENEYHAYRNFFRTTAQNRQRQLQEDLSRRLEAECSEVLDLHE